MTLLLALLLVFLAGLAIWRKVWSLAKGWTDAHVPLVVKLGAYDQVADDLDRAVTAAGIEVEATEAPAVMTKPVRWLAAVAGGASGALVPDRLVRLSGQELDILIYPMDLLISGKPERVARARAAMASRLTTSAAHLTASAETQALEDRLAALMTPGSTPIARPGSAPPPQELESIDVELATLTVPYDEWEVLYRQRLQVERDLRARTMADVAVLGASEVGTSTVGEEPVAGPIGWGRHAGRHHRRRRGRRRRGDGQGSRPRGRPRVALGRAGRHRRGRSRAGRHRVSRAPCGRRSGPARR